MPSESDSSGYGSADESDLKLLEPPENYGGPTITLADLLERAINHTYREFQILTELLKKKSGTERKISILTFAFSTRAIFLKLTELVRWVRSGQQVDQYIRKSYSLDQKSAQFVETADMLAQLARCQLPVAGMPLLQVARAAEILRTGTYTRLPATIMSTFAGEPRLTSVQTEVTLKWLSDLIKYRLIQECAHIPKAIEKIQVKNGIAMFTVPYEFKAYMILQPTEGNLEKFDNDKQMANWRWELRRIDVLISDFVTDVNSCLLDPNQLPHVIDYCNSFLKHELNDINTMYKTLHALVPPRLDKNRIIYRHPDFPSHLLPKGSSSVE